MAVKLDIVGPSKDVPWLQAGATMTWPSGWCPECPPNAMRIEFLGVNLETLRARWRCEAGHEWFTAPDPE